MPDGSRRSRFTFDMLGIPIGTKLEFLHDPSKKCVVADADNHIDVDGERTTLSAYAQRLLGWTRSVAGPMYFTISGDPETLSERRKRLELEADV